MVEGSGCVRVVDKASTIWPFHVFGIGVGRGWLQHDK